MIYTDSLLDVLNFNGYYEDSIFTISPYYGTLEEASRYLSSKIDFQDWSIYQKKVQALTEATRLIDNLRFIGLKTDFAQSLEFPRNTETVIPKSIKYACFELAFMLIHDIKPDIEIQNQRASVISYSTIRTQYQNHIQEHVLAGIPSALAWGYLLPYLVAPGHISLSRVS